MRSRTIDQVHWETQVKRRDAIEMFAQNRICISFPFFFLFLYLSPSSRCSQISNTLNTSWRNKQNEIRRSKRWKNNSNILPLKYYRRLFLSVTMAINSHFFSSPGDECRSPACRVWERFARNAGRHRESLQVRSYDFRLHFQPFSLTISWFRLLRCDQAAVLNMIGSEKGITIDNVKLFLGIIKRRIIEIIHSLNYAEQSARILGKRDRIPKFNVKDLSARVQQN